MFLIIEVYCTNYHFNVNNLIMLCSVCIDDIFEGDEIKCTICKEFLHFACASFRESSFRKLSSVAKSKFSCSKCKTSAAEIARHNDENISVEKNDSLSILTRSVNFLSSQFDDFGKQLEEVLNTIKELKNENILLKEKNQALNKEIDILSRRINTIEQKSILNYIEIIGIPESKNENCVKIVEDIALKLDQQVSVVRAYRMNSKSKNKSIKIVAEMSSFDQKSKLMEYAKKEKIKASYVIESWRESGIFVNNYLTKYNSDLFYKTRMFAKENNYKFVWFKDLKIFIKKNEGSRASIVDHISDLLNVQKPAQLN